MNCICKQDDAEFIMYIFVDFSHFKDYCVTITNKGVIFLNHKLFFFSLSFKKYILLLRSVFKTIINSKQ